MLERQTDQTSGNKNQQLQLRDPASKVRYEEVEENSRYWPLTSTCAFTGKHTYMHMHTPCLLYTMHEGVCSPMILLQELQLSKLERLLSGYGVCHVNFGCKELNQVNARGMV